MSYSPRKHPGGDPVIDTIDSDQDDILPSTPGQEHIDLATEEQDSASILGNVFNGNSIIPTPSPFKKTYASNSLDEPLVDEPLPIESASLSPFRMGLNSPLHSRSNNAQCLSVSANLPPHVMELDSPEHEEEESNDFNLENTTENDETTSERENISSTNALNQDAIADIFCSNNQDNLNERYDKQFSLMANKKELDAHSQDDLFDSQTNESIELKSTPVKTITPVETNSEILAPVFIPQGFYKGITRSESNVSCDDLLPSGISPSKRKRDLVDDQKGGLDTKLLKIDRSPVQSDGSDSDIEILSESPSKSHRDSIEVVYDKKKSCSSQQHSQCYDSQNLALVLTGTECSEMSSFPMNDSVKKSVIEPSPSLLSMPDSLPLTCQETISSFEESSCHADNTIRATQVEMICNRQCSTVQPSIQPLIEYPLASTSSVISSTKPSQSIKSFISQVDSQSSQLIDTAATPSAKSEPFSETPLDSAPTLNTSVVSLPLLDTPLEDSTQLTEEESVFLKGERDAKEQLLKEQHQNSEKNSYDSFETSPECESKSDISSISKCAINKSFQTVISSSQNTSDSSYLFSPLKNIRQDPKVTYVGDSDEDETCKKEPKVKSLLDKKKNELKTSTPNTSDVASPNISEDGQSIIQKDTPTSDKSSQEQKEAEETNTPSSQSTTEELPVPAKHSFTDEKSLKDAGANYLGNEILTLRLKKWSVPDQSEIFYTFKTEENEQLVLRPETLWEKIQPNAEVQLHSRESRRFSDISSISRSTISTGYLGDKSSSDSSRLSIASVISASPPKDCHQVFVRPNPPKTFTKSAPLGQVLEVALDEPSYDESTSSESEAINVLPTESPKGRAPARRPTRGRHPRGNRGKMRGKSLSIVKKFSGRTPSEEFTKIVPALPVIAMSSKETAEESSVQEEIYSTPQKKTKKGIVKKSSSDPTSAKKPRGSATKKQNTNSTKSASSSNESATKNVAPNSENDSTTLSDEEMFKDLTKEQRKLLKKRQNTMSEDEKEIFINLYGMTDTQNAIQQEFIKSQLREATIAVNSIVFARYPDDNYYSAEVTHKVEGDKWRVKYVLDNAVQEVREVNILPTNLLPRGFSVWVQRPRKNDRVMRLSDNGIIRSHCLNSEGLLYHIVDMEDGTVKQVLLSHMVIKGNYANELLERRRSFFSMTASPGANLSLDNIIQGKRRRDVGISPWSHSTKPDSNLDSSGNDEKPVLRPPAIRKKTVVSTTDTSEYEEPFFTTPKRKKLSTPKTRTPKTKKELPQEENLNPRVELDKLPQESPQSSSSTPKKRGRKPKSSTSAKKAMRLNPQSPSNECNFFEGYKFLITAPKNHPSDVEDFSKAELVAKIKSAKGEVLTNFDEANKEFVASLLNRKSMINRSLMELHECATLPASESPIQVLCLSNCHCITPKYVQCLNVGIPIVNVNLVDSAIEKNNSLNWFHFLLPAGKSLLLDEMLEQKLKDHMSSSVIKKNPPLMEGKKVFLATSSSEKGAAFQDMWLSTLSQAGATVYFLPQSGGNLTRKLNPRTDVVIADATIPEEQLKRAREVNVPLVSTQWAIQSIVAQTLFGYEDHHFFAHDYVPSTDYVDEESTDEPN